MVVYLYMVSYPPTPRGQREIEGERDRDTGFVNEKTMQDLRSRPSLPRRLVAGALPDPRVAALPRHDVRVSRPLGRCSRDPRPQCLQLGRDARANGAGVDGSAGGVVYPGRVHLRCKFSLSLTGGNCFSKEIGLADVE